MTARRKSSRQLSREIAKALAGERKALQEARERYLQALGYAGNTDDQVRKYHAAIAEIDAKVRLLK